MAQILSRQDLTNIIKIYKNYEFDEVKELLDNPDKLDNPEFVSSIINFKDIYENPLDKIIEFYNKYEFYKGGKRRGKKKSKSKKKKKKKKKKSKKKGKSKKNKKKDKKKDDKKDDLMEGLSSLADLGSMSMSEETSSNESIDGSESNQSSIKTPKNVPRMNIPQNILQMSQNVPQMPANVPQMPANVPQMPANVPQMPANVPQIPANVPQMPANVPQMPGNLHQNHPINYSNLPNKCPISNSPLIIPIILHALPPLHPVQAGGKKIYPTLKNQQAGHFYNASIPYQINYPGYDYLQKYMDHYAALKNQERCQKNNDKKIVNTPKIESSKSKDENKKKFNVPSEINLKLNLENETKNQSIDSPHNEELNKIVKELEDKVSSKLKNIDNDTQNDLSSDLQKNIREEIKQELLRDMKDQVKKKISEYLTTMIASNVKDNVNNSQPSFYQDTVPPFYNPGIVLP